MSKLTASTMRFNITLPLDIGQKVKATKNRSALIAESLRQKFAREDKERLAKLLSEGYKTRAAADASLAKDFEHTQQDGV